MDRLMELYEKALALLKKAEWVALFVLRASIGLCFADDGWNKLHNLDAVIGHFRDDWHVPFPVFNATLTSYTELVCGALVAVGLLTRLSSIPLVIVMLVAILTAKLKDLHGVFDLLNLDEWTYLTVFLALVILGPGAASVDGLIKGMRKGARAPKPAAA